MGKSIHRLSSIDHIFTGLGSYPIEFRFLYDGFLDEEGLKASLDKIVRFFPVMASILVKQSEDTYAFKLSQDGILFDVVKSDINYEDNDKTYEYINPVDTQEGNPLTKIRLTHTPKGSVLGVSISHSITDGFSYFHFLSSWARTYQGKQFLPPVHQRELLVRESDLDPKILSSEDVLKDAGLFLDEKRTAIAKEDLKWESRIFRNDELKALLSEVQKESEIRLSYNDIVTAQLSKEFLLKWGLPEDGSPCFISCPVDFRRILEGFPKTYFGNAVALTTTTLEYKDLQQISLAELALKIRSNVKKVNEEYIYGSVEALTTLRIQQKRKIFEHIHVMHPRGGLLVTNLSRLPVHEIEFNTGAPIDYSILTQTVRGAVVLPHAEGIEVRVCCPNN
jgi:shikimate O-hydroxycinnamoyltransferase